RTTATTTTAPAAAARFTARSRRFARVAALTAGTAFAAGGCTDARTKLVEPLGIDLAVRAREPLAHALRQSR
ncbi:MAG TPA: hypothetical protein DD795_07915, partial [Erythrobacter sp.]|nr:hypothetical protein [Erythrobacter sp.]